MRYSAKNLTECASNYKKTMNYLISKKSKLPLFFGFVGACSCCGGPGHDYFEQKNCAKTNPIKNKINAKKTYVNKKSVALFCQDFFFGKKTFKFQAWPLDEQYPCVWRTEST